MPKINLIDLCYFCDCNIALRSVYMHLHSVGLFTATILFTWGCAALVYIYKVAYKQQSCPNLTPTATATPCTNSVAMHKQCCDAQTVLRCTNRAAAMHKQCCCDAQTVAWLCTNNITTAVHEQCCSDAQTIIVYGAKTEVSNNFSNIPLHCMNKYNFAT